MVIERLIEYLALDSILQGYMSASALNLNSKDIEVWLADGKYMDIDLNKLKARVAQIQKEFLIPYALTTTGDSN